MRRNLFYHVYLEDLLTIAMSFFPTAKAQMQIYVPFSLQTTGKHPSVTKLYLQKKTINLVSWRTKWVCFDFAELGELFKYIPEVKHSPFQVSFAALFWF